MAAQVHQTHGVFNSTSTVNIEHTLSTPNCGHVLFCIAAILQSQIYKDQIQQDSCDGGEDDDDAIEGNNMHPEFNIDIEGPTTSIQDPIQMDFIVSEGANDPVLREKVDEGTVPSIQSIFNFLKLLHRANYPSECNIICLIYINRMTSTSKMLLTMENWKGVWLGAVILSQKLWSDNPMSTAGFSALVPSVLDTQLRTVESKFFSLIRMVTSVKPSQYAEYYFELRQLFSDITGNGPNCEWTLKPLTVIQGKRLFQRSSRPVLRHQEAPMCDHSAESGPLMRSMKSLSRTSNPHSKPQMTLEDVTLAKTSRYVIS